MFERPGVLSVGDQVVFGAAVHTVVAISGTMIRLLSDAGQASVVALPFLLSAEDFELVGPARAAPKIEPWGLLDTLPEDVLAAAKDWERHVVEVETGLPPDAPPGTEPRPGYDPDTWSLAAREKAKAAELTAAGRKTSARTVQRMRRRYRNQGLWGLVDSRYLRTSAPTGQVDPRVVAAATAVVAAQTGTSTGTKSRAITQIRRVLADEHGPGVVPMPSQATCYRLLDVLAKGRHTFGSAVTRRQTANKPDRVYTPTTAARPGELVHLDTTPLDVMAVMDDGVIGRAELVLAVDIATRSIGAGVLRPVGAKAVDAALILARMTVPEPMRPGWDQALAMSASRIPHQRLVSLDARMALAAAKPVIVPDTVVIDHGKVFLSEVFLRAADTLGISVQPAHEQTATDKAIIERTFASINTLFCQHVSGYTGRDVTRRGADVADRAVWSLADLQELFDEWLLAGWQTRPHEGLRHPFSPGQTASPNDAYAALIAAAGYVPVALTGEDYIELLPAQWRAIGDTGVQIDYRTYNSPELRPLVGQSSGVASKNGRWEVHYDPYDVSRVWVRNHRGRGWFTVSWTHHSIVRQPFADFTWRAARKLAAARGVDDANEMAVAVILAALLRRAEAGPDTSRPLARTVSTRDMPNHLPQELATDIGRWPAQLPEPAPQAALGAAPADDTINPDDGIDAETVVPFGLLDILDDWEGRWWNSMHLDARHPLATKEGWASFVGKANPEPPQLLSSADRDRMDDLERDLYNEARQDYHSSLLLVATPDIRKIIHTGQKLIVNNRGKLLGRRGLLVSGASGTGKSTSITQLGRRFQVEFERRNPGIPDRIPVVYILIPPDADCKALTTELAVFLGLPVGYSDSPQALAHAVAAVMRRAATRLVLVDELHRLDLSTRKGKGASDQLKYFFDTVAATFIYAGLDLEETNMFSGIRGRQIAGRFIPVRTAPFAYNTTAAKDDWKKLVATMEQSLRLHRHKPGTLIEWAPYLHARTGGMIGSLDQLIYEAANDAISDGSEKITKAHLDAVILDIAAGNQYEARRRPRQ